ncbi:MAG: hypothetical protein IPI97_14540 [Nitrosomonas sp.]|nr:hypothetical protein [Nitrosomonas sp.]
MAKPKHKGVVQVSRERPILFSAPMVRAILDGRKTQTRRIVKDFPGHKSPLSDYGRSHDNGKWKWCEFRNLWMGSDGTCPFGDPGDRLWVRETFAIPSTNLGTMPSPVYKADAYRDDSGERDGWWINDNFYLAETVGKWKPSIHMPRWASRINLEITNVRVERLQDISEEDAIAEGVEFDSGWEEPLGEGYTGGSGFFDYLSEDESFSFYSAKQSFQSLWSSINGPEAWEANPFVWCIEFKRI